MADVRIHDLPSAASWNGFFPQDKPGGSTECVSVATVEAKLVEDGFVKTAVLVAGYQPLENQRVSTTDSPTFAGLLLSGATANKLARFDASKNLVSYDLVASDIPATINSNTTGSAAKWTTPRTLTIGATSKTIDGTENRSWSLAEIGAQAALSGGTTNTLPKWTGAGSLGNSGISDNGTTISTSRAVSLASIPSFASPFIQFPQAANPLAQRNWVDISVPNAGTFIDNVLAIQNKSVGTFFGVTAYGNAAINFLDAAGTERGAVGYSRNNAIQPTGWHPNLLYNEIGNPFTTDAQTTDWAVALTIMAGGPYWGGAAKSYFPINVIGSTGKIILNPGGGGEAVNVTGGNLDVGGIGDIQAIHYGMQNTKARIREYGYTDFLGITTNVSNVNPLAITKWDGSKSAWLAGMGYGSGVTGNGFDAFRIARAAAGATTWTNLFQVDENGATLPLLSGTGTRMVTVSSTGQLGAMDSPSVTISKTVLVKRGSGSQTLYTRNFAANEMNVLGKTIKISFYATAQNPAQGTFEVLFGSMSLGHCGIIYGTVSKFEFVFSVETIGTSGKFSTAMVNSTSNGSVYSGADWGSGVNLTIANTLNVVLTQTEAGTFIINQMTVEIINP